MFCRSQKMVELLEGPPLTTPPSLSTTVANLIVTNVSTVASTWPSLTWPATTGAPSTVAPSTAGWAPTAATTPSPTTTSWTPTTTGWSNRTWAALEEVTQPGERVVVTSVTSLLELLNELAVENVSSLGQSVVGGQVTVIDTKCSQPIQAGLAMALLVALLLLLALAAGCSMYFCGRRRGRRGRASRTTNRWPRSRRGLRSASSGPTTGGQLRTSTTAPQDSVAPPCCACPACITCSRFLEAHRVRETWSNIDLGEDGRADYQNQHYYSAAEGGAQAAAAKESHLYEEVLNQVSALCTVVYLQIP